MSVRRALALEKLCTRHLEACDNDPKLARNDYPHWWGQGQVTLRGVEFAKPTFHSLINEAFPDHEWYRRHWPQCFDAWYDGSLSRQIASMLDVLPESVRKKYKR